MGKNVRHSATTAVSRTAEKRGGYSSSSKVVTKLNPPPKGVAPGARASTAAKAAK